MTRINLIPPSELTDQHLIAEYRELPRIFGAVKKKLEEGKVILPGDVFKLGKGHVVFFYNKLGFLEKRYNSIVQECIKRGFNIQHTIYDISLIPEEYKQDFKPTSQDIKVSQSRINEKLSKKPGFYKIHGKNI